MENNLNDHLLNTLSKFSIIDAEQSINKICLFRDLILKFNKKINLISKSSEKKIDSVHIEDGVLSSLIIHNHRQEKRTLLDLGSGNGIPGLIYYILYPELPVLLVDRDTRKVEFLKYAISKLKLKDVFVSCSDLPQGIEEINSNTYISRGFASIKESVSMVDKKSCIGAQYFHLKSILWQHEVSEAQTVIDLHWKHEIIDQYTLKDDKNSRNLILSTKYE